MALKKPRRVLIATASGGSGHLQAALARELELKAHNPDTFVIQCDVFADWMGFVGRFFSKKWNQAQKKGNVFFQKVFPPQVELANIIYFIPFFYKAISTLVKYDIDHIIDTNPLATNILIKAALLVGKWKNKTITFEKVLVELATDKAYIYYKPLRRLSYKEKKIVSISGSRPLLRGTETEVDFWKKHCNLSPEEVNSSNPPIRPKFKEFYEKPISKDPLTIRIQLKQDVEKLLLEKTLSRSFFTPLFHENSLEITLQPSDHLFSIMLGSQSAEKATLSYTLSYLNILNTIKQPTSRYFLFVFCSHPSSENHLLTTMHNAIQHAHNFPHHVCIIPLYFQSDDVVAPLMFRSNITLTRSGAITSHELLHVSHGHILIHSECKKKPYTKRRLLKCMPTWEAGNAEYLEQKKGAKVITPDMFTDVCSEFFNLESNT